MILIPIDDRRALARKVLCEHPWWSDRKIANQTGLTRQMIANHRAMLERKGVIAVFTSTLGQDGKEQPVRRCHGNWSLFQRIAKLRHMLNTIGDPGWRRADDRARRMFWQTAEALVEAAGKAIDRETGELS